MAEVEGLLALTELDVALLERVATGATGSRMIADGVGKDAPHPKCLMWNGDFVVPADAQTPEAPAFLAVLDRVLPLAERLMAEPVYLHTASLMDNRSPRKGSWHVDTTHGGMLSCMVPLDDITAHNGGTLVRNRSGDAVALRGDRGRVYCFRGDVQHCPEGNPGRLPRRMLNVTVRAERVRALPEHSFASFPRVAKRLRAAPASPDRDGPRAVQRRSQRIARRERGVAS